VELQEAALADRAEYTRYKELFETMLEAMPSSVLIIDRDLRIVLANRNFYQKCRVSREAVIGKKVEQLLPEAIVEHMDLTRKLRGVFANNRAIRGERLTYRAPGVPTRLYYYSIVPFSWAGAVENAVLLMEDVTEQVRLNGEVRRIERHLACVVESAMDIVLSADSHGRILTWNAAAHKLSGYAADDVRGTLFVERLRPDHRENFLTVFDTLSTGEQTQTAEWDLLTSSGAHLPINWVLSPMKDENGDTIGVVGVGRDLSERRKLEAQLLQAQKLAAMGVMADGIAHEIRNPLAVCSSAAQFLLDRDIDPEMSRECVKKILAGIQRASTTIENLSRFARPPSTTEMNRVDLIAAIDASLDLVEHRARNQKIAIHGPNTQSPVLIRGNTVQLQQVFLNLFLNAVAAMPDGGDLRVTAGQIEGEVIVGVADTGRGISQEAINNIFDPFFTLSPVGKGAGLGLSICYSIVEQHMGRIEVESESGKGTTFRLRFPALPDEDAS